MFSRRTDYSSQPNPLTQILSKLRSVNAPVLDLTLSNPTEAGLRYDNAAILSAFQTHASLVYDPQPQGLLSARQEVTRYYSEDHLTTLDPRCLFLTTSTSEAYSYIFRLLCDPQDELLVPKPSYPLFEFLAGLQDVTLASYPLQYAHGWFIDFPALERAITPRTRAILLVHPNNPTGSLVRPEERTRLNSLCREKNLALIVDEVFLDFCYTEGFAASFVANNEALTFTLSGLSKIAALPQMKLAWMTVSGPESLVHPALERLEIVADTYLSVSAPAQAALPALLAQRHSLRAQLLQRTKEHRALLESALRTSHAGLELLDAQAGWYAILRLPPPANDEEFALRLLEERHVLVHPGHFYDFPAANHIVLSLIPAPGVFRTGVERLLQFASEE